MHSKVRHRHSPSVRYLVAIIWWWWPSLCWHHLHCLSEPVVVVELDELYFSTNASTGLQLLSIASPSRYVSLMGLQGTQVRARVLGVRGLQPALGLELRLQRVKVRAVVPGARRVRVLGEDRDELARLHANARDTATRAFIEELKGSTHKHIGRTSSKSTSSQSRQDVMDFFEGVLLILMRVSAWLGTSFTSSHSTWKKPSYLRFSQSSKTASVRTPDVMRAMPLKCRVSHTL